MCSHTLSQPFRSWDGLGPGSHNSSLAAVVGPNMYDDDFFPGMGTLVDLLQTIRLGCVASLDATFQAASCERYESCRGESDRTTRFARFKSD